ncbi:MAG: IclR family transcriptional regulator [Acidobacteria bacterium]|nr:IclR family transcriptional regulator [Acidobacteriota bacterium]
MEERESKHGTLRRAVAVLRAFVDLKPEWGVRELAREIRTHPATVHRILRGLTAEGFLRHEVSQRTYVAGAELYRMGAKLQHMFSLPKFALPIMKDLVAEFQETVSIGICDPQRLTYSVVAQAQSENPIRHIPRLGYPWPLHAGAPAQAVLAFLHPTVIESVVDKPLVRFTPRTITDPTALRKVLSEIRRRGYACSRGEAVTGGVAIAAPLWDTHGAVGSLVLTMPEGRFRKGLEKIIGPKVQAAAMLLSSALGSTRT